MCFGIHECVLWFDWWFGIGWLGAGFAACCCKWLWLPGQCLISVDCNSCSDHKAKEAFQVQGPDQVALVFTALCGHKGTDQSKGCMLLLPSSDDVHLCWWKGEMLQAFSNKCVFCDGVWEPTQEHPVVSHASCHKNAVYRCACLSQVWYCGYFLYNFVAMLNNAYLLQI